MSICLDVIPSKAIIPTISELVTELKILLSDHSGDPECRRIWDTEGVVFDNILVEFIDQDGAEKVTRFDDPTMPLDMEGHDYGWLSADGYRIGFDFYYDAEDEEGDRDFFKEYIGQDMAEDAKRHNTLPDFPFKEAAAIGHKWYMRGAVGRSRATWLLAGFAAAALARLTDGFLYSGDGGADYDRLPEAPAGFMEWFPAWCYEEWAGCYDD